MIKNERQYRVTKSQLAKLGVALESLVALGDRIAPLQVVERDGLESLRDELNEDLRRYEELQSGHARTSDIASLDELPRTLIEARIAARMTQAELADRLNIQEQQIQRYESTDYRSASLTRILEVAGVLQVKLIGQLTYSG